MRFAIELNAPIVATISLEPFSSSWRGLRPFPRRFAWCANILSGWTSQRTNKKVNKSTVSRWGIYNLSKRLSKSDYLISDVVEKPSIKDAPSNKAVIGRYILPKTIFKKLKNQNFGNGGEIHITDAIQSLIKDNENFIAHNFSGKYLDCGTMNGYINSGKKIGNLWSYAW